MRPEDANDASPVRPPSAQMQCPYCSSPGGLFRTSGDINKGTTGEVFNYYRCKACSLVFMADIPTDMTPYYRKGYQSIPATLGKLRKLAAAEKYRLAELIKVKDHGRLLEIGPWIGMFSINAKEAGFEVDAIEGDEACVDFLRNVVGIKVFKSRDPAATLDELPGVYDAVVLWHSLEHLPAPWRVIESAAQALKPGGALLIAIPNIDSYESRVMRENWVHLDAPRHVFFYAPEALSTLCRRVGLSAAYMTTSDRLSVLLGLQAWYRYLPRCHPLEYLRGLAGLRQGLGSGLTAIFVKDAPGE